MTPEILSLSLAAAWTGFVHCLCGPDHYVPFIAMSRVGSWSLRKTLIITFLCGIGHVLGSAVLGFVGIALGLIVFQLERAEAIRGDIAAWGLFGFGAIYTIGGMLYALRRGNPCNQDALAPEGLLSVEGSAASHPSHQLPATSGLGLRKLSHQPPISSATGVSPTDEAIPSEKSATTPTAKSSNPMTPWILFVVFLFGPCEPLIPYLMVPAAKANMLGVAWITFLFGVTTLATMITLVALIYRGTLVFHSHALQRWGHAVAGLVVMACGGAMLSGL